MSRTKEKIEQLWRESCQRENNLIKEYRSTHELPSRGVISTPEIDAERAIQKKLIREYFS